MATKRERNGDKNENSRFEKDRQTDLFVMNNEIDEEISSYLKGKEVIYLTPSDVIRPGDLLYSGIAEAIQSSKKQLLILSQDSLKTFSFSLETLLSLEKCLQTKKLNFILLLKDGLKTEDVPKLPIPPNAYQIVHWESGKENERLIDIIKENCDIDELFPAGNMAAGMAWSHFTGYLELVLRELAAGITKSEWYNDNPGRMPICLFMLLPLSAKCPQSLAANDPDIEEVGEIKITIDDRNYNQRVWKVKEDKEEYYCVAQCPGAFGSLMLIHTEILGRESKAEKSAAVKRFLHYLNEILNHEKYKKYGEFAKLILYDDEERVLKTRNKHEEISEKSTVSYQLQKAIKDYFREKGKQALLSLDGTIPENDFYANEVCLLYHYEDNHIVLKIADFLDKKRIRYSKACPSTTGKNGDSFIDIGTRVRNARWTLFFITENTKSDNMIDLYLAELLSIGIERDVLNVIPVLHRVSPAEIPSFIRWAMHITIDDQDEYLDLICSAIRGKSVSMKNQIPIGNVAYGLAWAFYVNYLRHVLTADLRDIIKKAPEILNNRTSNEDPVVSDKLWEIIPTNCLFKNDLSKVCEEISGPWTIKVSETQICGDRRAFHCKIYRISTKGIDYFFAAEYLTPIKTLYNMHRSQIAGLSLDQMNTQRNELKNHLSDILEFVSSEEHSKKCELIEFDDNGKDPLHKVMIDKIMRTRRKEMHLGNLKGFLNKQEAES